MNEKEERFAQFGNMAGLDDFVAGRFVRERGHAYSDTVPEMESEKDF